MAEALDQPLVVVGPNEVGDTLTEVVDVDEEPRPKALLFQGADEPFGDAVALRLADKCGIVFDPEPFERPLEVERAVLAAPVVTQLDPSSDVRSELSEAIDDGVVERLERGEAVADLRDMCPRLVGVVVDEHEHPHPAVGSRPRHRRVGAEALVRPVRDHLSVVDPWTVPATLALRGEEALLSHQAEHPVLADDELVLSAQSCPHLSVSLTTKRALFDHLADLLRHL